MSLFIKNIFLVQLCLILAILYPTSLANLVVEVGTRHSHQTLLVDSIIIPILTYGAEGWDPTNIELEQIQTILNKALKILLCLPQQTLTIILLSETGYIPTERMIKKKRIMQAHRILHKKSPSLNKSVTTHKNSLWRMRMVKILKEYNLTEGSLAISKQGLGKSLDIMNKQMTTQEISTEANKMTKTSIGWKIEKPRAMAGDQNTWLPWAENNAMQY